MSEEVVRTATQARDWFLKHSEGGVRCIGSDGVELVCLTFTAAVRFFEVHGGTEYRTGHA